MHTGNSPNHESAVGLSTPARAASQHCTDFTILWQQKDRTATKPLLAIRAAGSLESIVDSRSGIAFRQVQFRRERRRGGVASWRALYRAARRALGAVLGLCGYCQLGSLLPESSLDRRHREEQR